MPRPGPIRAVLGVRLDEDTHAWIDEQAARRGITRSELVRLCLEVVRPDVVRDEEPARLARVIVERQSTS